MGCFFSSLAAAEGVIVADPIREDTDAKLTILYPFSVLSCQSKNFDYEIFLLCTENFAFKKVKNQCMELYVCTFRSFLFEDGIKA
jgi:hypothetical protein